MSDNNTDDEMTVVFAAITFSSVIIGGLAYAWQSVIAWLVDHQVLVPAAGDPIVPLPYADGVGLDLGRLLLLVALIAAALAAAIASVRRWRAGKELS